MGELDYATGFRVLLWAGIAAGFAWLGLRIRGDKPQGARKVLAWPFMGLAYFFFFLAGAEIVVNFFGGLLLEIWSLLVWVRSFF
jgi:hypothetical protein